MGNLLNNLSYNIGSFLGYGFILVIIIFVVKSASDKSKSNKMKVEEDNLTNSLIESLKTKSNLINCKVCGKEIPYNEYGTCEECHQEIMKRLEAKNKGE